MALEPTHDVYVITYSVQRTEVPRTLRNPLSVLFVHLCIHCISLQNHSLLFTQ